MENWGEKGLGKETELPENCLKKGGFHHCTGAAEKHNLPRTKSPKNARPRASESLYAWLDSSCVVDCYP